MSDYRRFIHQGRRSIPTPDNLVDAQGRAVFGTFQSEFPQMDLTRAKHPTRLPDFMNKSKLTLWQACEIHLQEGVLLAALSDMGLFGKIICLFWDRRSNRLLSFESTLSSQDTIIAPCLMNGAIAYAHAKDASIRFCNSLEKGQCRLDGRHSGKDGRVYYEMELTRISAPSIVSIPFGDNRPLYTEKIFLKAKGTLTINGETLHTDGASVAIIDDHRGYYPYRMHYDWVTTMGRCPVNGREQYFAFNLTRNQSIDQERYNENLIWFDDHTSLLPPVHFTRAVPSREADGTNTWQVRDDHDMVCVDFHVQNQHGIEVEALAVQVHYYIAWGVLSGYVRDEDGVRIPLDGMMGLGEDKSMSL